MLISDAGGLEQPPHRRPVCGALVTQVVGDSRRVSLERLALRHLAVEQAQRIPLEAELAIAVELGFQRTVVSLQALEVGRPALAVADAVELQAQVLETDLVQPLACQLDHLCVQPRRRASDRFHVELEELPVAALLWPVITEHRTEQIKTRGLRTLVEAAFEVSAHHSRGRLRSQGQVSPSAVVETIKLFGHRIGVFSHALDQLGVLEDRSDDLLVAEPAPDLRRPLLRRPPQRHLGRKDVAHAADGFDRFATGHRSVRL